MDRIIPKRQQTIDLFDCFGYLLPFKSLDTLRNVLAAGKVTEPPAQATDPSNALAMPTQLVKGQVGATASSLPAQLLGSTGTNLRQASVQSSKPPSGSNIIIVPVNEWLYQGADVDGSRNKGTPLPPSTQGGGDQHSQRISHGPSEADSGLTGGEPIIRDRPPDIDNDMESAGVGPIHLDPHDDPDDEELCEIRRNAGRLSIPLHSKLAIVSSGRGWEQYQDSQSAAYQLPANLLLTVNASDTIRAGIIAVQTDDDRPMVCLVNTERLD